MSETIKQYSIERHEIMSDEDIKEHLREVGRRIIADSDTLQIPAKGTTKITMIAAVAAGYENTYVKYIIERQADPRIQASRVQKGKEDE